jgi:DNA-directed RNA polymerase specialized sigma24 family protein
MLPLHVRFLQGDKEAGNEICARLFERVVSHVARKYHGLKDDHLHVEAVSKAFESYLYAPRKFKAGTGWSLETYLERLSCRGLCHGVRKLVCGSLREDQFFREKCNGDVQKAARDGYINIDQQQLEKDRAKLEKLLEGLTLDERKVVRMQCDHECTVEELAEVLGFGHLPQDERKRRAENFWRALLRKLQRRARKLEEREGC